MLNPKQSKDIENLILGCEKLCDILRGMRRENPNDFFDSPEEKLLKGLDGALTGFYRMQVDEPRELTKLKLEQQRLYHQINELERELSQYEPEEPKP